MDWLTFHKEFYFHELERKYSLIRSMSLPVGVATLLFSVLAVIAGQLSSIATLFEFCLFVLLICAALLLFASIYFMKCAYFNHAYHYLPTTLQIASHQKALEDYFRQQQGNQQPVLQADKETVEYLIDALAKTTHHNTRVNDIRARFLFWANSLLAGALFLLILCGMVMLIDDMTFSLRW